MKETSEDRRLLLAIALSLLAVTGYQLLFAPRPAPRPATTPSPAPASTAAAPAPASHDSAAVPQPAAAAAAQPALAAIEERRVEISGPEATLAFSNRGARLVSWQLSRFKDERGRPEEMLQASHGGPRPLDVETGDAALDEKLQRALFVADESRVTEGEARFEYSDGDVRVRKSVRLAGGFVADVEVELTRGGKPLPARLVWGPGLTNPTARESEVQGFVHPQAVALAPGGVERVLPEKLTAPRILPEARWAGVESQYFAALLLPPQAGPVELRAVDLPPGEDGKPVKGAVTAVPLGPVKVYVGPKDWDTLHALKLGFEQVVPIGSWLGPIVIPLLRLLRFVHSHVGNYGWSIVALTVLINLVMGPLRHMSIANGLKMAKLSPEMRAIQERYRKYSALDPKRQDMQKEVNDLYARHGMSMGTQMMVGCLPMLLTLPFLFAFYRVLTLAIELRGASFLWIPDLSHRDPMFLTPILLGISMFAMQKLTPSTMDPAQQRIMMVMPLMLVAMFFAAPAGLNLYWLASNLCSIVQQGLTLRILRSADERAKRERRRA
jgi:YidC/Oxa1 family membrane protein insertase